MTKHTTPTQNQTQAQSNNAPIFVKRSGAVVSKLWENETSDGRPVLSITFARTYTDPESGEYRESKSFYDTDVLKVAHLAERMFAAMTARRKELKQASRYQETPLLDRQG